MSGFSVLALTAIASASIAGNHPNSSLTEKPLLACQSGLTCMEVFEPEKLERLDQFCASTAWKRVASCDTSIYKTACLSESEDMIATWWSFESPCSPGLAQFTDKESVKAFLKKNELVASSITTHIGNIHKFCHVTLKETFFTNTNLTARLEKGSSFLVERYERPSFGTPARFVIEVDRGNASISTTVPLEKVDSNCSPSYIDKARWDAVKLVVKPMTLYTDESLTQEVCTLAPETEIDLNYECFFENDICRFYERDLEKACGVSEAYGHNGMQHAIPLDERP